MQNDIGRIDLPESQHCWPGLRKRESTILQWQKVVERANSFVKEFSVNEDITAAGTDRWNSIYNIVSNTDNKKMCSKSATVRQSGAHEWKDLKLQQISDIFSQRIIYNADETRLSWKTLSDGTLALKSEGFSGSKMSKGRLTCFICVGVAANKCHYLCQQSTQSRGLSSMPIRCLLNTGPFEKR